MGSLAPLLLLLLTADNAIFQSTCTTPESLLQCIYLLHQSLSEEKETQDVTQDHRRAALCIQGSGQRIKLLAGAGLVNYLLRSTSSCVNCGATREKIEHIQINFMHRFR